MGLSSAMAEAKRAIHSQWCTGKYFGEGNLIQETCVFIGYTFEMPSVWLSHAEMDTSLSEALFNIYTH